MAKRPGPATFAKRERERQKQLKRMAKEQVRREKKTKGPSESESDGKEFDPRFAGEDQDTPTGER